MFELYTAEARRAIFWARQKAGTVGSTELTSTHLLLGALREGGELFEALLPAGVSAEVLGNQILATLPEAHEMIADSFDMPVSISVQAVLALTAEESTRLGASNIDIVHLLLALARDETAGSLLTTQGISYERLLQHPIEPPDGNPGD